MKKTLAYGTSLLALLLPAAALAAEFRTGNQPSVRDGERIANDLYMIGGSVTSFGTVAGDLVAAGGSVVVSGAVTADVTAGGGNVSILSTVGDDVRAGGGNIVIQGRVTGDVIAGGGQVLLSGPGIGGDVIVGGGSVRIDAPVAGSVKIGGGEVYLNASIIGNVTIEANKVTLGPKAVISGTLNYTAREELTKEEGAVVLGEVTFELRTHKRIPAAAGFIPLLMLGKFLTLLACALIIGLVFRRYSEEAAARVVARPLAELGRGLLALVAIPIVSVLLLITTLGIPFGMMGILGFGVLMLFSWIIAPIIVGSIVYRYISKGDPIVSWKSILFGVFLFQLAGFVPFIGWLAQAFFMLASIGAVVAIKWQVAREWR